MESLSRYTDTEKVSIASCGSRMDVKETDMKTKKIRKGLFIAVSVTEFSHSKNSNNSSLQEGLVIR